MNALEFLGYAYTALPYVLAVAFAFALSMLLIGLYRSPLTSIFSILVLSVWEGAAFQLASFRLGIAWTPQDLISGLIGLVTILRLAFVREARASVPRAFIALVAAMLLSFGRGIVSHGTSAGVEFRSDFYFWVTCLHVLTFRPEQVGLDRLLRWWLVAAFLLCIVVWYRWTADAFGLDWVEPVWRNADATGVAFARVAPASVACFFGLALLISVSRLATGSASALHYAFIPALVLTIVVLQHRSVWVASLIPMLWLLWRVRADRQQQSVGPAVAVVVAVVVVAGVLGSGRFTGVTESVTEQAERATSTQSGTFVSRAEGWRALMQQWVAGGPKVWALGNPYGSGFARHQGATWGGVEVTYAPHNYYVSLLMRVGLVGTVAVGLLLWRGWSWSMRRGTPAGDLTRPLASALTMSIALYWIPYSTTFESPLLFGAVLCCAGRKGWSEARDSTQEGTATSRLATDSGPAR